MDLRDSAATEVWRLPLQRTWRYLLAALGALIFLGMVQAKPLPERKSTLAEGILAELNLVPRPGPFAFKADPALDWPKFSEKNLEVYQPDYASVEALKKALAKEPGRFPARVAVFAAIDALRASEKYLLRELFVPSPVGPPEKAKLLDDQKRLGAGIFELETALEALKKAGEQVAREPSKRWQAHYLHVRAALQGRIVACYEVMHLFALVRRDALPPLGPGDTGWRLAPGERILIVESKVKDLHKDTLRLWNTILEQHPGTPWAFLAQRERLSRPGLEWVATRK